MSEKEKAVTTIDPTIAAILEGFGGIAQELKQSRIEAPDLQAKAMKKAMRPSNGSAPWISVFNLRGEKDYPLPPLKCEIRAPHSIHPAYHGLDREEVELFNRLEPGEYHVDLIDGTTAKVYVKGLHNKLTDKLERLDFDTAPRWTNENKNLFPGMRVMLRQMLGESASDILTMKQEAQAIKDGLPVSVGE
jgi:hypothetical protein